MAPSGLASIILCYRWRNGGPASSSDLPSTASSLSNSIQPQARLTTNHTMFFLVSPVYITDHVCGMGPTWPDLYVSYENDCSRMSREEPPQLLPRDARHHLLFGLVYTSSKMPIGNTKPSL